MWVLLLSANIHFPLQFGICARTEKALAQDECGGLTIVNKPINSLNISKSTYLLVKYPF